jgi:peptidoglycan/xylan/chitin deacetylase (PgdA/CDA1 family)
MMPIDRSTRVTVLMYHAVQPGPSPCEGADAHYSVTLRDFEHHVQRIRANGKVCSSVADLLRGSTPAAQAVAVTFDDGHISNLRAAQVLARAGGTADYFVNPGNVGARHFIDWSGLRDMASSGMSIQSHGYHHRYLDDLSPQEVKAELGDSKKAIEDRLGRAVTIFAPPGGRVPAGLSQTAGELGYAAICSSRVGIWRTGGDVWSIPRLAMLRTTGERQFERWVQQEPLEIFRQRGRHALLHGAKRLLGNQGYERLRRGLLRSTSQGTSGSQR